jgi:D-arabinose 1-dehydrogenase-like Zn-dependent alcohol dehydrogenase
MRTRILFTNGDGKFVETAWDKPEPLDNEIEVKALMTGVCRSDIDMMVGDFGPLPMHMSGHEGLGIVTKMGVNVTGIAKGDYVATRGEPAYSDYYNVRAGEYVQVPRADPKYILEPVACGINVVKQADEELAKRKGKLLIIGSGFLAWVAYNTLKLDCYNFEIDVLGSSNQHLWGNILLLGTTESYDVVIDLSGKYELGTEINLNNNALIIDAVGKAVSHKEAQQQLWKAVTTIKPSPRTDKFIKCMDYARWWIKNGKLEVDSFWTRGYNRNTEWEQAFADGVNRPSGYSRGYIKWD